MDRDYWPRLAGRALVSLPLILLTPAAPAQEGAGGGSGEIEQIVVTGTRVANRSALDTAVPVDVVSGEQLQNLGVTEVSQALSVTVPSFNFPRPGLSDGTDTVRPATLRGLAPDQTLVLVNGKRRHQAALVNINNSIGRGSTAVDLNTIPNAIIQSVEVLRDGASAQYGSDAIAGVINLRLKTNNDGGDGTVTYGWRETSYDVLVGAVTAPNATWSAPSRLSRDRSDGETLTVSAWKGLPIGTTGSVVIAAEYKDQEHTERGGYDIRQQYPLVNGAYDPRETTFNRFNSWYGEPEIEQKTLFVNAEYQVASGATMYGWASYQDRDALSAGFYRIANDARNTIEIYPDGFLPLIAPEVIDLSAAFGVNWQLGPWQMDSSLSYGRNEMDYTVKHSLNRSLGPASKTSFDSGGFDYDQLTLNVAGVRTVEVGLASPLNIAIGVEARRETFSIHAGEPDSYRNGGVLLPDGSPTQSGAQVLPGFRPANEVDEDRTAVGAYIDLEANVTEQLLASVALRGESYSDFGENLAGKLSLRYDFTESFALRASVQNGFKAPSLQQQYFSTTSTNFIGGIPYDIATFPVHDPAARALGAQPLDAEESLNYSLGAVARLGGLTLTIDAYRIDIDDRIVLSENLTSSDVVDYLTSLGFVGIGGGRFFINGVDTETEGVDIMLSYPWSTDALGQFDFIVTANFNSTDVTRVPTTPQLSALPTPPILFNRFNVLSYEEGTPKDKYTAAINWTLSGWGATLRATRYGEVLSPDPNPALDFTLSPTTLVDLEARLSITDRIKVALGADNITDEYPDPLPPANNLTGTQSFSNYSPFGRSGRFVYGRLSYTF
ncbi:MAG TPA: TonB-dependent receptor [Steroidobacter sp.]|uniref:TonB-dependent receptor plug domain-containing protein n=1 Tax=Steroidobacter sp. TaxID=1978227 RepID=UPI002EDA992A